MGSGPEGIHCDVAHLVESTELFFVQIHSFEFLVPAKRVGAEIDDLEVLDLVCRMVA